MLGNSYYHRSFIILKPHDSGFGLKGGREPAGYCKLEIKRNQGKMHIYIQDLIPAEKQNGIYDVMFISTNRDIAPFKLTSIQAGENGRADCPIVFDPKNFDGTGNSLDQYHGLAIVFRPLSGRKEFKVPLIGYSSKRVELKWKGSMTNRLAALAQRYMADESESDAESDDNAIYATEERNTSEYTYDYNGEMETDNLSQDSVPEPGDPAETEDALYYDSNLYAKETAGMESSSEFVDDVGLSTNDNSEFMQNDKGVDKSGDYMEDIFGEAKDIDTTHTGSFASIDGEGTYEDNPIMTDDEDRLTAGICRVEAPEEVKTDENEAGAVDSAIEDGIYPQGGVHATEGLYNEPGKESIDTEKLVHFDVNPENIGDYPGLEENTGSMVQEHAPPLRTDTYWEKVKDYYTRLFADHIKVCPFDDAAAGEVDWIWVEHAGDGPYPYYNYSNQSYSYQPSYGSLDHYLVGLARERGQVRYVIYGIPGIYGGMPPMSMHGFSRWLPVKNGYGTGYWLLYIDCNTGDIAYPY